MKFSLHKSPDSSIRIIDEDFLYFGGTSYLGLQSHPDFQRILIRNIKHYGTNWGSSRISNVQLEIFDEFERSISAISGSEDAICVSSGFLAGQILAGYFSQKGYRLFSAPNSHPAIINGQSTLFSSYKDLEEAICENEYGKGDEIVLFLDSIDFSGGNYPHFSQLRKLKLDDIILVVDDSHGFGLIGDNGFGLFKALGNLKCKELIVCGSLGKACATPSGVILGKAFRIQDLRTTEYYAGGSPPSPAALKSFIEAEALRTGLLQKLRDNIKFFKDNISPIFPENLLEDHPVFGYDDPGLTSALLKKGIITTNFPYPSENSALVSKIVLTAAHSEADILNLCASINDYLEKSN